MTRKSIKAQKTPHGPYRVRVLINLSQEIREEQGKPSLWITNPFYLNSRQSLSEIITSFVIITVTIFFQTHCYLQIH